MQQYKGKYIIIIIKYYIFMAASARNDNKMITKKEPKNVKRQQ